MKFTTAFILAICSLTTAVSIPEAEPAEIEARTIGLKCHDGLGVCEDTDKCKSMGGKPISGYCLKDGYGVTCCEEIPCKEKGQCGDMKHCYGQSYSGYCPGPDTFRCCEYS